MFFASRKKSYMTSIISCLRSSVIFLFTKYWITTPSTADMMPSMVEYMMALCASAAFSGKSGTLLTITMNVHAGSVENETKSRDKERKDDHFSECFPLIDIYIDNYSNGCYKPGNNQPFDRTIDKCHQVQQNTKARV